MNSRKFRAAAAAFSLAAAVFAGTTATAVPAAAAPIMAPVHAAAPGLGELTAKLQLVLDTGASRAQRANELEAGEAGLPLVDQVGTVMAATPPSFRWELQGPVDVQGDTLTAGLQTSVDGYEPWHFQLTWRQIDGTWKLTREAECVVASIAVLPCTV
ncbi:hypothetical protein [Nocardia pseudobrasiliensis]|uniref:Low molecular weight antigen MTB12-like C-terminal domain-containing protein n=1 Tax=Nocardia pseudobrasiliensis TaxID=45979 RepID=A0A370I1F5_9NOCA|nr:hypothetical protein [Nocardia pseudobrasiliensis]RDI64575.1 hypothetical protein DFR76_108408 [Nocardia pseudobrasiliensis]